MTDAQEQHKRRWRDYQTASGARPIQEFLSQQSEEDRQVISAVMKNIQRNGLVRARHLQGDIYEVRANASTQSFRILFAAEGRYQHILLSLEAFSKKTQKTQPEKIRLAEQRLADWRRRGR